MRSKPQSNPPPPSVKSLVCLMLIAVGSKASPIPLFYIGARELGGSSQNEGGLPIKNTLGWLFAGVSVIVAFAWRISFLRVRNRPLRNFFTFLEAPQRSETSFQGLIPLAPPQRRGPWAIDTDSEGRRGGRPDPDDVNGDLTQKDILPAYEVKGGPPNYDRFLAVDSETDANVRPQTTEGVPPRTSQSESVGTCPGPSCPSAQTSPVFEAHLPRPPPPSYSPVTTTRSSMHRTPIDVR